VRLPRRWVFRCPRCGDGKPLDNCARSHIRGHRRYDLAKFRPELFHAAEAPHRTIAYACVSSNDQKAELERQKQVLELFCATNGWQFEVISDLGSGMNYRKKGQKPCSTKSWIAKSVG
jgi:predicted site-specific integrase-resolvase